MAGLAMKTVGAKDDGRVYLVNRMFAAIAAEVKRSVELALGETPIEVENLEDLPSDVEVLIIGRQSLAGDGDSFRRL